MTGEFPPRLSELSITAKRVAGPMKLPSRLDSLSLHVYEADETATREWLDGVKQVKNLHLNGTPLSDSYAEGLPTRYELAYLNIVDTRVSKAAVERIAANHPQLRMHPNLKAR